MDAERLVKISRGNLSARRRSLGLSRLNPWLEQVKPPITRRKRRRSRRKSYLKTILMFVLYYIESTVGR